MKLVSGVPTVGIVCTNYNNTVYTDRLVDSLNANTCNIKYAFVIVDNNSNSVNRHELSVIESKYENVSVVYNSVNIGYFSGLNVGIACLRDLHPDINYVVVGNNDLLFGSNFGSQICNAKPIIDKYPVVSPNIETLDGRKQNPHVIAGISRFRQCVYDLYHMSYRLARIITKLAEMTMTISDRNDEQRHMQPGTIHQGHGSCYILGPKFFQLYDKLWAPSFLMGEEYFLSVQLDANDYQVYYEPSIRVTHHCNGSIINVPKREVWLMAAASHKLVRKLTRLNRETRLDYYSRSIVNQ